MTAFPGPTPPYTNPPIQPEYYQPSQFFISDITLGITTTITTTVNMNYVIGQLVRLLIPPSFGTSQLNGMTGYVIDILAPDQVVLDINSLNMNEFKSSIATTKPQIVAVGDINSGIISSTGLVNATTNIPGSFINISPL
jgi:hypothetical protein